MDLTLIFSKDFMSIESGKLEKFDTQNKKFKTLNFGEHLKYSIQDKMRGKKYVEITL